MKHNLQHVSSVATQETSKVIQEEQQDEEKTTIMRNIEPLINSSMTLKEQNMFKLKTLFAFYH